MFKLLMFLCVCVRIACSFLSAHLKQKFWVSVLLLNGMHVHLTNRRFLFMVG